MKTAMDSRTAVEYVNRWRGGSAGFFAFVRDASLQVLEGGRWVPFTLWPWQEECLRLLFAAKPFPRTICIIVPRRSGKTTLAASLTLWAAYTRANAVIGAGANSADQAVTVPYRMLRQMIQRSPLLVSLAGGRENIREERISLPALGSEIRPLPNAPASVYGVGFTVAWVSELGEGGPDLFNVMASGVLDRPDGFVLVDSTPAGPDHLLSALHQSASNQGGPDSTVFSYYRSWRPGLQPLNPNLKVEDLEARRRQMLTADFARLHCAEWVGATDALFPQDLLERVTVSQVPNLHWLEQNYEAIHFVTGGDFSIAGSAHGDRSFMTTVAVGVGPVHREVMPSQPESSWSGWDGRSGTWVEDTVHLYVIRCTEVPTDADRRAEMEAIRRQIGDYPERVCLEQYQAAAFKEHLQSKGIRVEFVHAAQKQQAESFTRLYSTAQEGRLFVPKQHEQLHKELRLFSVDSNGIMPVFGARGKGRGGSRDDAVYSLNWAVYAARKWGRRSRWAV